MEAVPLATLALLGAYHGLNPAMGWLFAVGLGMQDRDRGSVLRALPPLAVGHELALAVVALLVVGAGMAADPQALHVAAAAILIGFGVFRFAKPRAHPRWTTMRVTPRADVVGVPDVERPRRGPYGHPRLDGGGGAGGGCARRPFSRRPRVNDIDGEG
jgi:hypothetical protein